MRADSPLLLCTPLHSPQALKGNGVTVSINADKPRKGAFVICKVGTTKPLLQLLDMVSRQRGYTISSFAA